MVVKHQNMVQRTRFQSIGYVYIHGPPTLLPRCCGASGLVKWMTDDVRSLNCVHLVGHRILLELATLAVCCHIPMNECQFRRVLAIELELPDHWFEVKWKIPPW